MGSFAALDNITIDAGVGCSSVGPGSIVSGDVQLDLDSTSPTSPTIDATFEYSLDSGVTYPLLHGGCRVADTQPGTRRLPRRTLVR